jgi:hypothetical protein
MIYTHTVKSKTLKEAQSPLGLAGPGVLVTSLIGATDLRNFLIIEEYLPGVE